MINICRANGERSCFMCKYEREALDKWLKEDHNGRPVPALVTSALFTTIINVFNVSPDELKDTKCHSSQVAKSRWLLMYLLRTHADLSDSEIGRIVGLKDHSTVRKSIKRAEEQFGYLLDIQYLITLSYAAELRNEAA